MSIDTTFKPLGPTTLVGVAALQPCPAGAERGGVVSFRVRNISASASAFNWGIASTVTYVAPVAGTPQQGMSLAAGAVIYIEVPCGSFFIASVAASLEVTPGMGGVGG